MISTLRNNGLKDKVVIIASQRSGKCIPSELAQIFLSENAIVHVADISEEILRIIEEEAKLNTGHAVNTFRIDFSVPGEIERLVQEIKKREGRIDILVTDFGLLEFVPHLKPFHTQNGEEWRSQITTILEDALSWSKSVIPAMIENNSGRIIHVLSEASRVGTPFMSVYAAAKAGVAGFSRSLAAELARYNITVNCVSLGIQEIEKRGTNSEPAELKLNKIRNKIPLRRFGEPEEISFMVAFIASDLGAYITGQNISVSGGMIMI